MIFVTVGSQKFQFNRLLRKLDELVENGTIQDEIFAQTGYSDYCPQRYAYKQFLDRDEFVELLSRCHTVVTHGGTGVIINAVKMGKKVIAVPRLAKFGEHVDDHQLQLLGQFSEMSLIEACYDTETLAKSYRKAQESEYSSYQSNTQTIIDDIENYILEVLK